MSLELTKWFAFVRLHSSIHAERVEGIQPCLVDSSNDGCRTNDIPSSLRVFLAVVEEKAFLLVVELIWLEMFRLRIRLYDWIACPANVPIQTDVVSNAN